MVKAFIVASAVAATSAADVKLADFGSASDETYRKWTQKNDPVMGGASKGQFTVSDQDKIGTMAGTVALIPRLRAPGFIKATALGNFADVSHCSGIELEVRSALPYTGYRFNFGTDRSSCGKLFARGFKADFMAPLDGSFGTVQIPFNKFSNCWDDGSGDQIKTCADDSSVCPTKSRLQSLQSIEIWAEGVQGDVKIDVKSVGAYGCGSATKIPTNATDDPPHQYGCAIWESCYKGRCCGSGACDSQGSCTWWALWDSCYDGRCCGSGSCAFEANVQV